MLIDEDGNGVLSNGHEYVFAEWACEASDDPNALRQVFDSNGGGKLTGADTRRGAFRYGQPTSLFFVKNVIELEFYVREKFLKKTYYPRVNGKISKNKESDYVRSC